MIGDIYRYGFSFAEKRFLINLLASMFWKSAKKTTAKEAMGLMENGKALFIDVRLPMHYQKVLIKGL